jgi:hypothetical protein
MISGSEGRDYDRPSKSTTLRCRHFHKVSIFFLLIALLPSLAHASSLEGSWYGKGYQPLVGKTMQWISIIRSDGSYSVEFREYRKCQLVFVQVEEGRWTVSGDIETNKTITINGKPVRDEHYFTDTYKILQLDDHKKRVIHEKTQQEWTLERVDKDFIFPACETVS